MHTPDQGLLAKIGAKLDAVRGAPRAGTHGALVAKLRAEKWPWIGVGRVTFTLPHGERYTPPVVTADEGVIVAWHPVRGGIAQSDKCKMARVAHLLPQRDGALFVVAHRFSACRWVEEDVVAARKEVVA